jgi:hypothetical protein
MKRLKIKIHLRTRVSVKCKRERKRQKETERDRKRQKETERVSAFVRDYAFDAHSKGNSLHQEWGSKLPNYSSSKEG